MEAEVLFNRFKGMFWGLVVGDCLGSPIQFTSKDGHPHITEMVPCRTFHTPAGYWTDDSSMAFCVADSLVRLKSYDLKDIANNFVRWYFDGFWSSLDEAFDVGGATAGACNKIRYRGLLKNGSESSQGNGSIMRFAPSYLIARKEGNPKVMHEISDLTHCSKRVRGVVDRFAAFLDEHLAGRHTAEVSDYKTREEANNSGWAVSTLESALWAFNLTNNFRDAFVAAVNLGGDSDTIGAVCGQLAGAFYGYSAIPKEWIAAVKDWERVDALIDRFLSAVL